MDTKLFFILITVFACFVFSCNSDTDREPEIPTGEIEEEKPDPFDPYENVPVHPPVEYTALELVFTGDDIKSFNITTGEIVFTDSIFEKLTSRNDTAYYYSSVFYYNDKPLFENIKIMQPNSSNPWRGYIVLYIQIFKYDEVLKKRYYEFYLINKDTTQKYNEQWEIFINYLTETDKIVR